jgi:primosomal protein N' (replication factor Y) (superfamily II helicase)
VGSDHRVERALIGAVRVIPDVPSFAVDDGFAYSVPDGLDLGVGDIVRVPLGGRRVRGWVIGETGLDSGRRLRAVLSRSGDLPVFDRPMLGVLRWAAGHYVAPMASVLAKVTPPNLPRVGPEVAGFVAPGSAGAAGGRALSVWVGPDRWSEPIGARAESVVSRGQSVIVVAPTWAEASAIGSGLEARLPGTVVVASSHLSAAEVTAAWVEAATTPGRVVVGTREVGWWRAPSLGLAVVVGEGRRGMKDKATPTVHARDLLLKRGSVERFPVVLCDQVPSAEALLRVSAVERPVAGRAWGLVEVVDRRHDASPGTPLGETAVAAVRATVADGRRVLLFTHRRVTAQRCVSCRELRRCAVCGAAPGAGPACARCGTASGPCSACGGERFEALGSGVSRLVAEAARIVGRGRVGEAGATTPVVVGTERDLPGLSVDVTVVVDADGLLMAPTYRAAEDGLRLLARAVSAAGAGSGRKAVVQTMQPDHPALRALKAGDATEFVRSDGEERSRLGFPPGGELIAVETRGLLDGWRDQLTEAIGSRATVLGPAPAGDRQRWLVQARDLTAARVVLRSVVAQWREGGVRVRVDADPLDL